MKKVKAVSFIVVALLVLVLAFSYVQGKNREGALTSGIEGKVLLGPTCPVEQSTRDEGCANKYFQTNLELTTVDGLKVIKKFSSDSAGLFKVSVAPGDYAIRNVQTSSPYPSCGKAGLVPVEANKYTRVTVNCDTGIR
ncbi:MAG: hypothetical protein AAB660_02795 [Patescibacteria group bacterium]